MDKGAGRQQHVVLEVGSALQSLGTGLVTPSTKCHEIRKWAVELLSVRVT